MGTLEKLMGCHRYLTTASLAYKLKLTSTTPLIDTLNGQLIFEWLVLVPYLKTNLSLVSRTGSIPCRAASVHPS